MEKVNVLVLGGGTAGSNSARAAVAAGAEKVVMVHEADLLNTCIEEGCMPSKSILAGAHQGESLSEIATQKDAHIDRLRKALTDSFADEEFTIIIGQVQFVSDREVAVKQPDGSTTHYQADSIVIATGSTPFTPPIEGLDTLGDKAITSEDVVAKNTDLSSIPKKILTIGGGPIGLEVSTFFHDLGSEVVVLQRKAALGLFDPEFGEERVRASQDPSSFPIRLNAELIKTELKDDAVVCHIQQDGEIITETYDKVLVATGRKARLDYLALENTTLKLDSRGNVEHNEAMQTSVPHIFIAGDVTGHHQILHFAAEMGKVAGHNAAIGKAEKTMDYDKHMLAVSFDQFPSALIGLTENEATKRGLKVVSAIKNFNSIGLGILKRQEYGLWKLVAEADTGKIIGSQILGPDSAGELIQVLVPIIANQNTAADIQNMTWYHPTYAEIIKSLARDIEKSRPQE